MTALLGTPADFGYAPAREARMASERAMARGFAASFALLAFAYAAAYLVGPLLPVAVPAGPAPSREPVDLGRYRTETWRLPPPGPVAPSAPSPGIPVPVPDPLVPVGETPELLPSARPGEGGPAAPSGPAGGVRPQEWIEPLPEPGVFVAHDEAPVLVSPVAPEYPEFAREAQIEGTVVLWALVERDGTVGEVRVMKSIPVLDEAAVAAVSRWRFTPALASGRPLRVWVSVPVRFSLR